MIDFLNPNCLIGTYRTQSGEHAFVRYGLVVDEREIYGFRAGVSHREIVEAVFVEGADSVTAAWCLAGLDTTRSMVDVLIARGIDFRFAHRATAPDLAVISSAESVDPTVWITSDSTADGMTQQSRRPHTNQ